MPQESRLFVKTGLVALVATFLWGGIMTLDEARGGTIGGWWPIEHAHLAFVGWLVNTVIGFALWFLPLNRQRYAQTQGRYFTWMPWTVYVLLNGGLLLRIFGEPFAQTSTLARTALAASAAAQIGAIAVFAFLAWSRTRPPARPAAGVK